MLHGKLFATLFKAETNKKNHVANSWAAIKSSLSVNLFTFLQFFLFFFIFFSHITSIAFHSPVIGRLAAAPLDDIANTCDFRGNLSKFGCQLIRGLYLVYIYMHKYIPITLLSYGHGTGFNAQPGLGLNARRKRIGIGSRRMHDPSTGTNWPKRHSRDTWYSPQARFHNAFAHKQGHAGIFIYNYFSNICVYTFCHNWGGSK